MMIKTIMHGPLIIIESNIPDKTTIFLGVTFSWFRPCRMTSPDPEWTSLTSEDTFDRGISPRVLNTKMDCLSELIMEHLTMITMIVMMKWIGWFRGTPIGKPLYFDGTWSIGTVYVCIQFSNKAMCHWAIFILPVWKTWPIRHNLRLECWFLSTWG